MSLQLQAYKILCLLDGAGKFLSQLIFGILDKHIEFNNEFRKGRSILYAIKTIIDWPKLAVRDTWIFRDLFLIISLDVRDAFNLVPWIHIKQVLRERQGLRYLADIIYEIVWFSTWPIHYGLYCSFLKLYFQHL